MGNLKRLDMAPLAKGSSKKVISKNIAELENSDTKAAESRTHEQNIAIALQKAGKSYKK